MKARYYGATDQGKMRSNNEDTFFVQPVLGGAFLAACVIDGVGGYEGGEVAARIAHDVLLQYLQVPSGAADTMLVEAMSAAHEKILATRRAEPRLGDMACVATLALIDESNNRLLHVHVGDTRLYLYRDGSLVKLTRDQSFVGFLEDNNRIGEAEAMNHLKRNEIDKALGFEGQGRPDTDYFDRGTNPFLPGDLLLLCSDGLTDLVPAAAISSVLDAEGTLQQKTKQLIDAANHAGGKDNITVVLVQHGQNPRKQRAVKPKDKKARTPGKGRAASISEPEAEPAPPVPTVPKRRSGKGLLLLALLPFAALLAWWLLRTPGGGNGDAAGVGIADSLAARLTRAADSVRFDTSTGVTSYTLGYPLLVSQDTLLIDGGGIRLVADSLHSGTAFDLAASNRHLVLQHMVLEGFAVGIRTRGQTVQLNNVQFFDCAVPVQTGAGAPVNSPDTLLVSDSLFTNADTTRRN